MSKSAAFDFMGVLIFFEKGGGVGPDKALHLDPAVQIAVAEARARAPIGGARDKKVAPPILRS